MIRAFSAVLWESEQMGVHLQANDLEASYGKLKVLRGVSLEVAAKQIRLIIGRNGSGKSTTLKAIFGLVALDRGQILLNNQDISRQRPDQKVKQGIALVPQTSNQGRGIFKELSIEENLKLGAYCLPDSGAMCQGWEQVFQLFPMLRDRQHLKAGALSGGQQQMLAVSIALMAQPRVLMLDEPTSGLAVGVAQELAQKIREIADTLDLAVILVEQNVKLALEIADWVYACRAGSVVRQGTAQEIMAIANLFDIL
jgi:branched-chain amino acid transport system ATP-binding protein